MPRGLARCQVSTPFEGAGQWGYTAATERRLPSPCHPCCSPPSPQALPELHFCSFLPDLLGRPSFFSELRPKTISHIKVQSQVSSREVVDALTQNCSEFIPSPW